MASQTLRLLSYLAALAAVVVAYAVVYDLGMSALEGRPVSFVHSLGIVIESFTTTGFGSDAPWTSEWMVALVSLMQFTGILFVFMALPLFVVPLLEESLSTRVPSAVPDASDHVVICEYTAHGETLIDELDSRGVGYVVVQPDEETATALYENGRTVIQGDPESVAVLRRAGVERARAVVADADDERNASVVLSAREVAPDVQVIALSERPEHGEYHRYAGADTVLTPEHIVGESLADKVTSRVSAALGDAVDVGAAFEIAELSVQSGSDVCRRTIADSGIRERTGANVIGLWQAGEFASPPSPGAVLEEGSVLLASGTERQLEQLTELTRSERRGHRRAEVVVAGYGEVGATVADALGAADVSTTVIDLVPGRAVDVVGDATEERTLSAAGVAEASTLVVALATDTETIFATLVARELAPDVEIVVRADEAENVPKLYRAGADYVLAVETVSGRMLASTILEEEVLSLGTQVEIVRTETPGLVGQSLGEADVRARTGCTVIAVERDGAVHAELSPEFVIEAGDRLVVAGRDVDVNRFAAIASGDGDHRRSVKTTDGTPANAPGGRRSDD